jgi:hypothetical protein
MRFKLILMLFLWSNISFAQQASIDFIKSLIESVAEDLPADYDLSELEERLLHYYKHPINLNGATIEELNDLIFLSPIQLNNIRQHIKEKGKLLALLELQSIAGLDLDHIQKLLPFITIGTTVLASDQITYKNLSIFSENDLVVRLGSTIENQKGYQNTTSNRYLGSPIKLLWRYKYTFSNRISASLILEKDAGEPTKKNVFPWALDYGSAHLAVYNIGFLSKVIVGDFTLQFGQGLTLWSGFAFGKAPDVASVAKKEIGLKPYSSANEFSFFRGIATTLQLSKKIKATIFGSFRKLDAVIDTASNGEERLTTINETGYHRTSTELEAQNKLSEKVYGGILQYQVENLNLGIITYQIKFNKKFESGEEPYRLNYFNGKQLTNAGINYSYNFKNFYLFGETAKSILGGWAYTNGLLFSLSTQLNGVILLRNYAENYHNFFNRATSEASEPVNEKGTYIGLNFSPKKSITISFYADYFSFPWLKFRVDAPSEGYEILSQITYTPNKTFKAIARFKTERKEQNTSIDAPINYLVGIFKNSYRIDINWSASKILSLQNRLECSTYMNEFKKPEFGYLFYQDIAFNPIRSKLSGNMRLCYFSTVSFNNRIYAYEDDVLYNFSFAAYSEEGYRFYLNMKYKLFKKMDIWARYGLFIYSDKLLVGSGPDEISGNKKSDIKFQVRYQF